MTKWLDLLIKYKPLPGMLLKLPMFPSAHSYLTNQTSYTSSLLSPPSREIQKHSCVMRSATVKLSNEKQLKINTPCTYSQYVQWCLIYYYPYRRQTIYGSPVET